MVDSVDKIDKTAELLGDLLETNDVYIYMLFSTIEDSKSYHRFATIKKPEKVY
jgi:hypothetical protein